MLTVKHIRFDGAESIDHAARALFYPSDRADMRQSPTPYLGGVVTIVRHDGLTTFDYRDGLIYVMNDAGSTVAKYDLGDGHKEEAGSTDNAPSRKAA